jgi:hypothetical protein
MPPPTFLANLLHADIELQLRPSTVVVSVLPFFMCRLLSEYLLSPRPLSVQLATELLQLTNSVFRSRIVYLFDEVRDVHSMRHLSVKVILRFLDVSDRGGLR